MLPAGAALGQLPHMCPSIPGWRAALRVLRGAALVYDGVDKSRIQMLSPIQSYILLHHPLEQESLNDLRASYYKLAPWGKTVPSHAEFKDIAKELAKEDTNMAAILISALRDQNGDMEEAIEASLCYSQVLFIQQPRTEVIEEAIQVSRQTNSQWLAHCLYWHATILDRQGSSDEARPLFEEARTVFIEIGDRGFAADCSGFLGTLLRDKGQYSESFSLLEEARDIFLELDDVSGAAQRLWDIGHMSYAQGDYKSACSSYEQARSEFISVGDDVGSLRCLMSTGAVLGIQGNMSAAESALEEARLGFIDVGDLYNAAWCLRYLADTFKQSGDYSLSMTKYEETITMFGQIGYQNEVEACKVAIDEIRGLLANE